MSIQDRDWYIDLLRRKDGYVERARFRVSLGKVVKPLRWHPVLLVVAWVAIFLAFFTLFKVMK